MNPDVELLGGRLTQLGAGEGGERKQGRVEGLQKQRRPNQTALSQHALRQRLAYVIFRACCGVTWNPLSPESATPDCRGDGLGLIRVSSPSQHPRGQPANMLHCAHTLASSQGLTCEDTKNQYFRTDRTFIQSKGSITHLCIVAEVYESNAWPSLDHPNLHKTYCGPRERG